MPILELPGLWGTRLANGFKDQSDKHGACIQSIYFQEERWRIWITQVEEEECSIALAHTE